MGNERERLEGKSKDHRKERRRREEASALEYERVRQQMMAEQQRLARELELREHLQNELKTETLFQKTDTGNENWYSDQVSPSKTPGDVIFIATEPLNSFSVESETLLHTYMNSIVIDETDEIEVIGFVRTQNQQNFSDENFRQIVNRRHELGWYEKETIQFLTV